MNIFSMYGSLFQKSKLCDVDEVLKHDKKWYKKYSTNKYKNQRKKNKRRKK